MLQLTIPIQPERWDEKRQEFIAPEVRVLQLEHSLVSIDKWESKWLKSFLSTKSKTDEELIDYIKCMTITQNVDSDVYNHLTNENIQQIKEYINAPMTATTFSDSKNGKKSREIITSEVIYWWMIVNNIPFECKKWHINKLIALIRVCTAKNSPRKKSSNNELLSRNHALNMARRKKLNSRG